ncbi:MAG: sialidase family protein [Ignisphaera sp.]|uniref:Sialidase domain-containing protein n=1 Tax=Ignisphaera aggregans TaxID=334771 RepID=A0A7C4JJN7_9CREN
MEPVFIKQFVHKYSPNMPMVHAPTIVELPDRDLLTAWFAGTAEGKADVNIWCSRLPKGSNQWSEPQLLADIPGNSDQNPVLFVDRDGVTWLIWTSFPEKEGSKASIIMCMKSYDSGRTWTEPRPLVRRRGYWTKHPPVIRRDGSIVLPVYDKLYHPHRVYALVSEDGGQTWDSYGPVTYSCGCVQGAVVELSDGTLLMFMRPRTHPKFSSLKGCKREFTIEVEPGITIKKTVKGSIGAFTIMSTSKDGGRTWTEPVETMFKNPNSAISLIKLLDGSLVVAFNDSHVGRAPLNVALSEDDGKTWPFVKMIEPPEGMFAYPFLTQSRDGMIHLVYSWFRLKIAHVMFNKEWLKLVEKPAG